MDYLKRVAGHRSVPVELGSNYLADGWTQSIMPLAEFIDQHVSQEAKKTDKPLGYLAQHDLFSQVPVLKADLVPPDYTGLGENGNVRINAWFGPQGTVSPCHTDPTHNLLAQVVGSKLIRLFHPDCTPLLYPHDGMTTNSSQVDVENPDLGKFPEFSKAAYVECILEEGEVLYIPPLWWHYIRSLSVSFSVSFWFD